MKKAFQNYFNTEVSDWYQQGIITEKTRDILAIKYAQKDSGLSALIKWLGFFAIFFLGGAILTFISIMAASEGAGGIVLLGVACAAWYFGTSLVRKIPVNYPFTGSAIITFALAAFYGSMILFISGVNDPDMNLAFNLGYVMSALSIGTAYKYRLRWPLLLGLLVIFHLIGSGHAYLGDGSYVATIVDERRMAMIAFACAVFGLIHERIIEETTLKEHEGFGHLYVVFGLIYFNCSLWFLSLHGWWLPNRGNEVATMLLFTAATLGQIILGARLHDGRLTGFGIVFLGINIYTRFFETFWDTLSAGQFFLTAGVIGMAAGYLMERFSLSGSKNEVAV